MTLPNALIGASEAVRELAAALTFIGRRNSTRAAVIDLARETRVTLSMALLAREKRQPQALADACEDMSGLVRLTERLDPKAAEPLRLALAELEQARPPPSDSACCAVPSVPQPCCEESHDDQESFAFHSVA